MIYIYVRVCVSIYLTNLFIYLFIHVLIHLFMCGCTLIYDWSGATLLYTQA